MISTDIRRDLLAPLRHFTRLQVVHLYRRASYGDLTSEDMANSALIEYSTPSELWRHLGHICPDIIQGVEPFAMRLLPYLHTAFLAARRRHVPLMIVTLENRPLRDKYGLILSRLLCLFLRPIFGYARLIICVNEGARRNVLSVGPYGEKLQRLMYGTWGVDPHEFTPQRDGREPAFGPGPIVLFAGRLHAEKGVFELLEAFTWIKAQVPMAKLVMIGDGPARDALTRMIQARGWEQSIMLVGALKNRDLPPYFRTAHVFVSPSITTHRWEEQVGMTNIQAMACGVPVVSTHSGAIPEYVPDGVAGILVPERQPQALAEAITRLLCDEDWRQRMGDAGRLYAIAHYHAGDNVRRAEELILAYCGGKGKEYINENRD